MHTVIAKFVTFSSVFCMVIKAPLIIETMHARKCVCMCVTIFLIKDIFLQMILTVIRSHKNHL